MFSTGRFRGAIFVILLLCSASSWAQTADAAGSLYRVFLRDGTTLLSYGEYARVSDRLVMSVPLGGTAALPDLHLVSIPSEAVDWDKTDAYAEAVRAARYAGTRGPDDFAMLSGAVTTALNDIAVTSDPKRKIAMAGEARQNVMRWIAEHYGYRAEDVARMASLFDGVVADTQAAAGIKNVDLSLIANLAMPPSAPLLAAPSAKESAEQALRAAELAPDATERISLLRAIDRVLLDAGATGAAWPSTIRARVSSAIAAEERASRGYDALTREALRTADRQARLADVTGVERAIRRVLTEDDRLGQRRPQEMASLLAMLDGKLDAARRLRLAEDSRAARMGEWRRFRTGMAETLALMQRSRDSLDQIRRLAGPSRIRLRQLVLRAARASTLAASLTAPAEAAQAQGLLKNAIQLASRAAEARQRAVFSGDMKIAWDASAAASGALILLDRVAGDVKALDHPPKAPRRP